LADRRAQDLAERKAKDLAERRAQDLAAGLGELGCRALLVVAQSASDPDLAPFLGARAHLGAALLVAPREGRPRLAYLNPMEREEAAATGLLLVTPEELEVLRAAREAPEPAAYLAWVMSRALAASGVAPGRVALAGLAPAGEIHCACAALARQGWEWVAGNELVRLVRKRKTAPELAAIRQAADAAVEVMRALAARLAAAAARGADQGGVEALDPGGVGALDPGGAGAPDPGGTGAPDPRAAPPPAAAPALPAGGELWLDGRPLTVGRLRTEAARLLADRGIEQPHGNILAPGGEGGVPHSAGSDSRPLRAGEPLIVDLFPRGAWRERPPMFADCTRTLCVGEPPPAVARAHAAVLRALAAARALATPGARGWDLQEAVCLTFEEAGYATPLRQPGTTTGYVHNLGHGIGYELHELPIFRKMAGAEGVLAEGDVFTLEPGLYDPAAGYGVRLEDLCYLGPDGLEVLTPLPYDLDPRRWVLDP
jgi:Xaa-Pro aminopeptidase